jgi:hypothetical protein
VKGEAMMVNVKDFDQSVVPQPTQSQDKLALIFSRQRELMEKYHDIEQNNGFMVFRVTPVDLHNRQVQQVLKDYAWRVTEELTEATQALDEHADEPDHFDEELADAYHFLVELMIMTGTEFKLPEQTTLIKLDRLDDMFQHRVFTALTLAREVEVEELVYKVIQHIGNAMNCLKNKPWKTTHMLTNEELFHTEILEAHQMFINLLDYLDWKSDKLMNLYFRKARVNQFRQESNY